MNVYLFRHGEVENSKKVLYGRLPGFHLSEKGKEHTRKTAQKLKDLGIKRIYSSPLERAVETAEILVEELGLGKQDLIIDNGLIESNLAKWQGTDLDEFREKVVFGFNPREQKEFELITHSGKRVLDVLNGSIKKSKEDAVIVSHGDPLVGCLINITGDWSPIESKYVKGGEKYHKVEGKYLRKGEFVKLTLESDTWVVGEFSYDTGVNSGQGVFIDF